MIRVFIVTFILSALSCAAVANDRWYACIDNDYVAISDIECLISTDGETSFSLLMRDGKMKSGINRMSFELKNPEEVGAIEDLNFGEQIFIARNSINLSDIKPGSTAAITSIDGRIVNTSVITDTSTSIDISILPAGTYLLNVNGTTIKFMKR